VIDTSIQCCSPTWTAQGTALACAGPSKSIRSCGLAMNGNIRLPPSRRGIYARTRPTPAYTIYQSILDSEVLRKSSIQSFLLFNTCHHYVGNLFFYTSGQGFWPSKVCLLQQPCMILSSLRLSRLLPDAFELLSYTTVEIP